MKTRNWMKRLVEMNQSASHNIYLDIPTLSEPEYPESECFPNEMIISFSTSADSRGKFSRMFLDGRQLGDDLRDNVENEDGYRYHDVFHLACVAKLRWSPVMRKLMNRKRKSNILARAMSEH